MERILISGRDAEDPVRTRALRDHRVAVSELGFGAAQLGNLYRTTTDREASEAFSAAWETGVRYFDTAPHYGLGLSEQRLGRLLIEHPRDDYVISTKVGRLLVPTPNPEGKRDEEGFDVPADYRRVFDLSAQGIRRSVEESLERLGTDRIDILYLHDPDGFETEAIETAFPELIRLREQGMVRAVGAGMNDSAPLTRFIQETDIDVVMVAGRLTLLDQSALKDLMPAAAARNVSVVAAGVYNSGILGSDSVVPGANFNYSPAGQDLVMRASAIAAACERHGTSLPAAAIAYPLRFPQVKSVVLGARTGSQAAGNTERYRKIVPESLWDELEELGLIPPSPQSLLEISA
ncbi:aldo/keto reductase [Pseudarthrobacter sp. alpha12b]